MKKSKISNAKKRIILLTIFVLGFGAALYFAHKDRNEEAARRSFYSKKAEASLKDENAKLGEPLKALGFTDIKQGEALCNDVNKNGPLGSPGDCNTTMTSYRDFPDETVKATTIQAAEQLSLTLEQNGWQRGNYELGQWFKDVLNGVDWNPDAYHQKFFDETLCVIDFYVAYSNPSTPAVNATFNCSAPATDPLSN